MKRLPVVSNTGMTTAPSTASGAAAAPMSNPAVSAHNRTTAVDGPPAMSPGDRRLEERLTELEIKASFADDLLDTLNGLVARQQETIELLVREVSRLRQQGGEGAGPGQRDPRDELPPHY